MSCGGNCQCGTSCKCSSGSGGCKMYPDLSYSETAAAGAGETVVLGVAPQKTYFDGSETVVSGGENGCKCNPCTCNPCNCK